MVIQKASDGLTLAPLLCPDTVPCENCQTLTTELVEALLDSFQRGDLSIWEWVKTKAQSRWRKVH